MDSTIFFKEDTSKPENRTNLAFFSILMIPEVHDFVCDRLKIPRDLIILPSPNLQTEEFDLCQRPDFKIVKSLQESHVIGYIEVELGREDEPQIGSYRASTPNQVYSIVGKRMYTQEQNGRGDLSLEEIAEFVTRHITHYGNCQQTASMLLFTKLVQYYVIEGNFSTSSKRALISDKMVSTPLVQMIIDFFGKDRIRMEGRVTRGLLSLDTIKENGFSLRVYSSETTMGFSLMSRSKGRAMIEFPSLIKLLKYFPHHKSAAEHFSDVIFNLGAREIKTLPERNRASLGLNIVEENFNAIGRAIESLM